MSEYNQTLTDSALAVTEGARARIAGLVRDAGDEAEAVRIYVSGGGCGGMNYGMPFAERAEESDCVLRGDGGVQMVVGSGAVGFLRGAQIDFGDDGVNWYFGFHNVF